ncbi:rho GTPase-activating protein 32-like isoform X5 [Carassius carassius]|uniref:rho GTPase-activating protein 32-like isoform X5 n=1 Tax=Carassius carassius TaxID=217509 RepID=UPI002869147F|nr:rho GTPase-activating protein 32-like isoform X5 [Carassius carassius]
MLMAYLSRFSAIADNKINCGPALTWMEVDNKGNHLLVHEESSINVPAIAAAHVIKRYIAQAADELSFEVGDIVSVIDMPPKEDTTWWRGKHGFQVGFFPSECVELINDKVPQSVTNSVPKPVSKKHGKLITFLRTFMKSRPTKQKLKQRGILRERVFGCDLGEHLLNSGHDVPQVLKSCTEFIEKHGVVDGMYRLSGIASNIQKLRHEFDSEQIPDLTKDVYIQDIHCVGSLCKLYFRELPNPLLTYQLYEKFSEAVSAATDEERLIKIHDVIQQLPPPHYRTLEFLMRHLSHLATFSYVTNMHTKNLAIVWAPNLLRSKQIESACFSGTAAFMEVRIQSVVVEFILNHVDVLFSPKLSSLIREGTGHNSLSRPKSLLVPSPSTKLLTLEEAQARTQAQINSPITADSKYIEVGEGPAALQGKFHTVIEFPTERKRQPIKSKKSPVGSWRSFFNLGKSSSMSKRKLHRNPSEPNELKAMALAGGRGDTGTLRSAKSEESLTSLHNVEGESKVYRPRRPRSSSDALSASFNGGLLDSRQHCNSYDNLGQGDSDGDDGPISVPALISPPRSADDVDLSPPDIGMASLDFDPMSFQCSLPLAETSIFSLDTDENSLKRSPGSASGSEPVSPVRAKVTSHSVSPDHSPALEDRNKLPPASFSEKAPVQSHESSEKSAVVTPLSISDSAASIRKAPESTVLQPSSPPSPLDSPAKLSSLSRSTDLPLSEAIQQELLSKAATFESKESKGISSIECSQPKQVTCSQDQPGAVALDSPKGNVPVSSVPLIPPPPPPKNAARMLALALAESAQQASILSQRQSSGPPTPVSPVKPQEFLETMDWPPPLSLPSQPSLEEAAVEASKRSAPMSSPPSTPTEKLNCSVSLHLNTAESGKPSSISCNSQDVISPETPSHSAMPIQVSQTQKSPERQQPAVGQTPVSTDKTTTTITTPAISSKDTVIQQPSSEIHMTEMVIPPKPIKMPDQPIAILQPQPQIQTQPHAAIRSQPQVQSHSQSQAQPQFQPKSQPNARVAPTPAAPLEPVEKPWEAIKPVHPKADCVPQHHTQGVTPPTPPVRSIESKLAMAALCNTETGNPANLHAILEASMKGSVEETPPQSHPSHRRASTHQSGYIYHSKGDPALLEPTTEAYYHQRVSPSGQATMAYHYRPESVPPHVSYVSKSEPQISYRGPGDGRYNTIGPRSYHQSIKSHGPLRSEYISPGSLHHSHGYNQLDGPTVYPTIRRVHSLHVPPTAIRSTPVTRTEVPPDDELFYYQRPVYHCKSHQPASQADYHVTQLQPYFENGRVQYRYSPYSGSHVLDAPFYDVDHYGTIRLRHVHSFSGRDSAPLLRSAAKSGAYHYLSRHFIPLKEHGFVSRDIPPYGGSKGSVYFAWDPDEAERLRMHSIRRESRARQKVKGSVMSQYDNIGPYMPMDIDMLHMRSKSDSGKTVLMAAESKEARYNINPGSQHASMHLISDPDVLMYMETEKHCQGNGMGDKTTKQGSSRTYSSIHSHQSQLPPRSLQHLPEGGYHDLKFEPGEKQPSSKHWQEHSESRTAQPRYERSDLDRHICRVKATSSASEDEQAVPVKPAPPPKPERSHSVRERQHYNQSSLPSHLPDNSDHSGSYSHQSQAQSQSNITFQSHYDNLDDYHPVPQSQTSLSNPGGSSSYHSPGFSTPHSNLAYSTALGQGAFIQAELSVRRPETEINAE